MTLHLHDLLHPRNEIVHPRDRPSGDALFVGLEHIEPHTGRRVGAIRLRLDALTGRKARFYAGDIVYGYLRPYLNKVWVAEFDGYCSVDQYVFQTAGDVDVGFIAAFMRSPVFLERAPIDETPGQLPRIRLDEVLSVALTLPPRQRQVSTARRVAEFERLLESMKSGAIGRRDAIQRSRRAVYSSAFQQATPLSIGGLPASPPGWRWSPLEAIARLESGHTPRRSRPDWWGGDVPWIQLADIRATDGKVTTSTRERTNAEGIAHSAARVLPADTVVMSRTASVGFVARMGRPMATSQDFVNWVCGPDLDPEFLMHLMIRSREYIRSLASGAVHKTVYYPTVKQFHVCIPPIDEQRRIATELRERLATIDAMNQAVDAQLEAVSALPAALLRRAFENLEAA